MVPRIASHFLPLVLCILLILLTALPVPVTESVNPFGDRPSAITGHDDINPDSRITVAIQDPTAGLLSKGIPGSPPPTPSPTKPPLPGYIPCLAVMAAILVVGRRLNRR
jgi:hypothetical protein